MKFQIFCIIIQFMNRHRFYFIFNELFVILINSRVTDSQLLLQSFTAKTRPNRYPVYSFHLHVLHKDLWWLIIMYKHVQRKRKTNVTSKKLLFCPICVIIKSLLVFWWWCFLFLIQGGYFHFTTNLRYLFLIGWRNFWRLALNYFVCCFYCKVNRQKLIF